MTISHISRVLTSENAFEANREIERYVRENKQVGFRETKRYVTQSFGGKRIRVVMKKP